MDRPKVLNHNFVGLKFHVRLKAYLTFSTFDSLTANSLSGALAVAAESNILVASTLELLYPQQ
jgi:hypothetical protein